MNTGAFILTGDNVTVVVGSVNYTMSRTHSLFPKVLDAIRQAQTTGNWDDVTATLNMADQLTTEQGATGELWFNQETGEVFWNDEPLHSSLSDRITDMWRDGFDTQPLLAFCRNLFSNPSKEAISELYDFLSKNLLPLTTDGCFLAYKKVREDYMDCHSGTISNVVGATPEMDRATCDMDRENHCSRGLHFCGLSYLTCFGGERVMIVKVNPRDVTSIPSDYNFAKGRCCKYEVVEEYGGTDVQRFEAWSSSVADWDEGGQCGDDFCSGCGNEECNCGHYCEEDDYCGGDTTDPEGNEDVDSHISEITNPIRRARITSGITAVALSEALNLTLGGLFSIEREGARPSPSVVGRALLAISGLVKNFGEM